MKKLLLFFLITKIFSAKIAFVLKEPHPYDATYYHHGAIKEKLEEHGHSVHYEIIGRWNKPNLSSYDILLATFLFDFPKNLKNKTLLYLFEPPVVVRDFGNPDSFKDYLGVFTWDHTRADGDKFIKAFFPVLHGINPEFKPFKERNFACIVGSEMSHLYPHRNELYSKRREVARFYDIFYPNQLVVYGRGGWDKYNLGVCKGGCDDKHVVLRDHKFCYCFENWDNDVHYISEKLMDCIQNRCVGIYLGSKNISDYVPKECFIDAREFDSLSSIHSFLESMDETTWNRYIKAMEAFFKNPRSRNFKKESYIELVVNTIEEKLQR